MKVFDIKSAFRELEEKMSEFNPETGEFLHNEDEFKEFIEALNEKKELKLNNIEDLKREYKSKIGGLEDKIKSLNGRKKQFEKIIDNLQFLQKVLLDGEKLKTDEYSFYFTTSKSVKVPDVIDEALEDLIKIEKSYDKKIIKDRLENANDEIKQDLNSKGFYIETKKSLVVR